MSKTILKALHEKEAWKDKDAQYEYFTKARELSFNYLLSISNSNTELSQDLAQDTMIKLHQKVQSIHSNIIGWICEVSKNKYLEYRKKDRRVTDEQNHLVDITSKSTSYIGDEYYESFLNLLDEKEADYVMRKVLGNETGSKIAMDEGKNPSTINRKIDIAMQKLRFLYQTPSKLLGKINDQTLQESNADVSLSTQQREVLNKLLTNVNTMNGVSLIQANTQNPKKFNFTFLQHSIKKLMAVFEKHTKQISQ